MPIYRTYIESADPAEVDSRDREYIHATIGRARRRAQRLSSSVDTCARTYVTDPTAYGSIQASPYVLAGPGPWAPEFTDKLRAALTQAAGNGG